MKKFLSLNKFFKTALSVTVCAILLLSFTVFAETDGISSSQENLSEEQIGLQSGDSSVPLNQGSENGEVDSTGGESYPITLQAEPEGTAVQSSETGWVVENGARYYKINGVKQTGWKTIDGIPYYFNPDNGGAQWLGWAVYYKDSVYYLPDGSQARGIQTINGKRYYFNPSTGAQQSGWKVVDGVPYYFDSANGGAQWLGWAVYYKDSVYYLPDGSQARGIQTINGKRYFFNTSTGAQQSGWQKVNGIPYYFDPANGGAQWLGWAIYYNDRVYYLADGSQARGWVTIDGQKLYFNPNTGAYQENGPQDTTTGFVTENGARYYKINGVKQTGWKTIDGVPYYFDPAKGGAQWLGWAVYYNDRVYYLADGSQARGWVTIDGKKMYFNPNTGAYQENGPQDTTTGFVTENGARYYKINGVKQTGWKTIDGVPYYFDPAKGGAQWLGWAIYYNDRVYYLADGSQARGWVTIDGKKMYFNPNTGAYQENGPQDTTTGFVTENGARYYKINGVKQTGWKTIDGIPYYFDPAKGGAQWLGWAVYYKDSLYYLPDGSQARGIQTINGRRYYFNMSTGVQQSGWQVVNGIPYYFDSANGGAQWLGWATYYNEQLYYLPNGNAAVGTVIINGLAYTFNEKTGYLEKSKSLGIMIDVSSHQGIIDWNAVKNSGVEYVIIRALSQSGNVNEPADILDPYFMNNVRGAKASGLKVGAYIYTYAFNNDEAIKEINLFDSAAKQLAAEGYTFDLPVFIDQEYPKMLNATTYQQRTDVLRYSMVLLDQRGYYPGMYLSTSWAKNNVNAAQLQSEGYDLWVADYRGSNGYGNSVAAWQYTSSYTVSGIAGGVDASYLYKDYKGLINGSNNSGANPVAKFTVYDQNTGKQVTDTIENLVAAIVNNEVGGGLGLSGGDRKQLYCAQAVATRSWLMYHWDLGTVPSVALNTAGNYNEVKTAVATTAGEVLVYNNAVANTVYGASSAAATNSAQDYWGNAIPYLVSVQSPYEGAYNNNLYNPMIKQRTAEQVKADLAKLGITVSGDASEWINITGRNAAGYVTSLTICGTPVKIDKFYETVVGPYSPNFKYSYDAKTGTFTFTAYGYGHCVGMSQWGAAGYIGKEMKNYQQVLQIYYPGTKLEKR